MNDKLKKLYSEKWENLSINLNEVLENPELKTKPTNPLLISLENNNYENADIKLIIFGQETNDWEKDFNGKIDSLLPVYKRFFNDGYALKTYGGQFWNGVKRFLELLQKKYPNKTIGIVWNNVIKIGCSGRNKNMPPQYIYKTERKHFDVIKDELNILKPNVILFMSGPNYDYVIEDNFGKFNSANIGTEFSKRQLSKLNIGFGENVFRTYHPTYLWRTKRLNEYYEKIINEIKI
ncbi:hypothetical protein [Flavobacterium frigoris]|uniref:Uracil DNA glycosylase superfamily protein n=1 Tax=Flavobacterium frigoris TaxID=229204 RepID=A0A1H9HY78_FLAFI|nr:hypothetical protein [Flavobacterium frigoris]SEQ67217.1 Uracil DNA glycosylase superfamily protein [Flavobacterium frigoris]